MYICQKVYILLKKMSRSKEKITTEGLIKRLEFIHGDRYNYSLVEYSGAKNKITIICPEHGEFNINPFSALNGRGCPKCAGRGLSNNEIIEKIKKIHGNKYDYSKVEYKKSSEKICLICPIHGEFWITTGKIFNRGDGCPICAKINSSKKNTLTQREVIDKFINVHGDTYIYDEVEYKSMHEKVRIKCGNNISNAEDEIYNFIKQFINGNEIIRNDRTVLDGKEIDIYIPKLSIGIEYNGLRWHSEEFGKDKYYHLNKLECANRKGIKLIQIFEDEYINKKNIVLSKIRHLLGFNTHFQNIMARKTIVTEINNNIAKEFLDKNHIQGYGKCSVSYGCFYENKLIGVMSFTKYSEGRYELVRFASDNNVKCSGIGGKLFKFFLKEHNPIEVKTFADRRWTINRYNNLYTKLGFNEEKILKPEYRYVNSNKCMERYHKFNFRKRILHKKYGLPLTMSENEMTQTLGYFKVYDCGLIRYIWKRLKCNRGT